VIGTLALAIATSWLALGVDTEHLRVEDDTH